MAYYGVEDETCCLWMSLDTEPLQLDLRDGLGAQILDLAEQEMLDAVLSNHDPTTGEVWAPDAPSTVRQKGSDFVGHRTGAMMDPSGWTSGVRAIEARTLNWFWNGPRYGRYFHNGNPARNQPARHITGWTPRAIEQADELIKTAVFELDADEQNGPQAGTEGDPSTWPTPMGDQGQGPP